jgi:hypothetical protein
MSRIQYDIGARGEEVKVDAFISDIRSAHSDYYTGRYTGTGVRSVQRAEWEDFDEFITKLTLWLVEWSVRHPEVEIFSTASEPYGALGVRYTAFRRGELEIAETIESHDRFTTLLSDCDCVARPGYHEKYPTEAPFVDCPIRLNPPTAWAVENIMYAMDNLPVRRTR